MSTELIVLILFVALIGLLLLGVPLVFVIGGCTQGGLWL